jgi:hypothetical protein
VANRQVYLKSCIQSYRISFYGFPQTTSDPPPHIKISPAIFFTLGRSYVKVRGRMRNSFDVKQLE